MAHPNIAVVGSGPAGCYTAQALLKEMPVTQITMLERLPVPFGLLRYGVAADHQGTKAVSRQFDRLLTHPNVRFVGNVCVGADIGLEELRAHFDAVVIATGLHRDRALGIEGEDLDGVVGSGRFTRWLNGHPDEVGLTTELGRRVVVLGAGNVAIDVARLLAKARSGFAGTDLPAGPAAHLAAANIGEISLVGRSSVEDARFDPAMIKELAQLDGVRFDANVPVDAVGPAAEALRALTRMDGQDAQVRMTFRFGWTPRRIHGDQRVGGIAFSDAEGGLHVLEADTVIGAIGFTGPADLVPSGAGIDDVGRVGPDLYCVGWAMRGPRGTIPDTRADGRRLASAIARDLGARGEHLSHPDPTRCLASLPTTGLEGWLAIDRYERATATDGRVRNKVVELSELRHLAHHHVITSQGDTA